MTTLITVAQFLGVLICVALPCFTVAWLLDLWDAMKRNTPDMPRSLLVYASITTLTITCLIYLAGWL